VRNGSFLSFLNSKFWLLNSLPLQVKNLFLYLLTVAIWGSTWYAITFQLNGTPTQVSIAYRFALATVLYLACWE
jgi:hypothetical protein